MTAMTLQPPTRAYGSPLVFSAVGHVVLALLLSSSLVFIPEAQFQQLAIEAVVVDQTTVKREPQRDLELERRQAAEAAQKLQEEQLQREQALVAERKAAEAAKVQRAAEQRAAAEEREQQQLLAEQQRRAAEAEAAQRKQQQAEQAAKRAQEQKAAEARARAAAEKREQQRLQAELTAALEAEEALVAASQSGEMNRYKALIQQRVQRSWRQPNSAVAGVECQVSVQQLPTGDVIDVKVNSCNGDQVFERSVVDAVQAASPLPLPKDRRLFDRNLTFSFRPQVQN